MTGATITVYLAGRTEDLAAVRTLRDRLKELGVRCTSRWLEPGGIVENPRAGALRCLMDIASADVVVLVNLKRVHRSGTGGRHVETGIALASGKPIVVLGERENVFHHMPRVHCVPGAPQGTLQDLVAAIQAAASTGNADARAHIESLIPGGTP